MGRHIVCFSDLQTMCNSQHVQGICGWLDKSQLLNFWRHKLTSHCKREPLKLYLPTPLFTFSSKSCWLNWALIPGAGVGFVCYQTKKPILHQKTKMILSPYCIAGSLEHQSLQEGNWETSMGGWYCYCLCHMAQAPSIFLSRMMKLFSQFNDATRDLDGGFGW